MQIARRPDFSNGSENRRFGQPAIVGYVAPLTHALFRELI